MAWVTDGPRDIIAVVSILGVVVALSLDSWFFGKGSRFGIFATLVPLFGAVLLVQRWVSRRPPFLAVAPAGVVIRRICRARIVIPWSDVNLLDNQVRRFRLASVRLVTATSSHSLQWLFSDTKDADFLAAQIHDAKQRYHCTENVNVRQS